MPGNRVNVYPFTRSFAVAGALILVHVISLLIFAGPPASAHGVGHLLGRDIGIAVIAALVIGFVARRSRTAWSWGRYVLFVFLVACGVSVFIALGQMGKTQ
jgi:hypothetical protein